MTAPLDGVDDLGAYLTRVGRLSVPTHEQQIVLSRRIEAGLYARHLLDAGGRLGEDDAALDRVADEGDVAFEAMVVGNLRLVVSIAKTFRTRTLTLNELVQEGNLGLIHAVKKFDWARGFHFSTYATPWIRQAIVGAIEASDSMVRVPSHFHATIRHIRCWLEVNDLDVEDLRRLSGTGIPAIGATRLDVQRTYMWLHGVASRDKMLSDHGAQVWNEHLPWNEPGNDTDEEDGPVLDAAVLGEALAVVAAELGAEHANLVEMAYGLGPYDGPSTLAAMGRLLGLSPYRVRVQLHRALDLLADALTQIDPSLYRRRAPAVV